MNDAKEDAFNRARGAAYSAEDNARRPTSMAGGRSSFERYHEAAKAFDAAASAATRDTDRHVMQRKANEHRARAERAISRGQK